jgi:hypothetical protein
MFKGAMETWGESAVVFAIIAFTGWAAFASHAPDPPVLPAVAAATGPCIPLQGYSVTNEPRCATVALAASPAKR